ncbi:MAG: hypothetical protein M3Z22_00345 [Verrucomicrobiota bacterium]|nr:hypothetical protein [Verrucomicrobiota bacterium]
MKRPNTHFLTSPVKKAMLSRGRKLAGVTLIALCCALFGLTVVGQNYPALPADKAASMYAPSQAAPTPAGVPAGAVAPAPAVGLGQKTPDTHLRIGNPVPFQAFQPCRVLDTRGANGASGGPKLVAGAIRNFPIATVGGLCASTLPAGIKAIVVNLTMVNSDSAGYVTAYPGGSSQPLAATVNVPAANTVANNGVIIPLAANGSIDVFASTGTHIVLDIVGYFLDTLETGDQFAVTANTANAAAIVGFNNDTTAGSHGVGGFTTSGTTVFGVQGNVGNASTTGSAGVRGLAPSCCTGNPPVNAGVLGNAGSGASVGVVGIGDFEGVRGINTSGLSNTVASFGSLGWTDTTAIFGSGNSVVSGTKSFVEPHPTDPNKVIKFVSLEGPEAGTYFRGRGKFKGKQAIIEVPETFRMVTEEEGLSVQVTPIGKTAQVAVTKIGLNQILVKASEDVEFFYTVNGERRGFKDFQVVTQSEGEFAPTSPNATMPTALSALQKQKLIATGVYNQDGTPNLATAQRYGWDKNWDKDEEQRALARQADPSAPTVAGGAQFVGGVSPVGK